MHPEVWVVLESDMSGQLGANSNCKCAAKLSDISYQQNIMEFNNDNGGFEQGDWNE
jgi:hypothetical protein